MGNKLIANLSILELTKLAVIADGMDAQTIVFVFRFVGLIKRPTLQNWITMKYKP